MEQGSEHLELLRTFLSEGHDLLDAIEPRLIEMQESARAGAVEPETLNSAFRAFHSIKGSAASLRLANIATVSHHAESLLDVVRKGHATFNRQYADVLLKAVDFLRTLLQEAAQKQTDQGLQTEREALLAEFIQVVSQTTPPAPQAPAAPASGDTIPISKPRLESGESGSGPRKPPALPLSAEARERFVQEGDELLQQAEQCLLALHKHPPNSGEPIAEALRSLHSFKGNCGFIGLVELASLSHKAENILQSFKDGLPYTPELLNTLLKAVDALRRGVAAVSKNTPVAAGDCAAAETLLEQAQAGPLKSGSGVTLPRPRSTATMLQAAGDTRSVTQILRNDLRVDLVKLDMLVNLVGELVIAEAMVTRHPAFLTLEDEGLERAVHHLRRVLSDLQDVSMVVRMIPLSATFRKMVRLVHDLSSKVGKQVKLELLGEETEVDKSVIELLSDPLVHILRNSLDHGIETPQERAAAGKPAVGTVSIEAKHEGGEVVITISDDGRGLDRGKILAKALERGLVRDPNGLRDRDILNLIFEPGFSTAEKVTDVSGRGVGMDVVKKNIEKLKGRIELRNKLGVGLAVVLRLPLTLAIINGMLVRVGPARYMLPMLCIRESFRPELEQITITPDGQELVRVRNELIPVLRLHRVYGTKPDHEKLEEGILIVVEGADGVLALFADEILDQQQTVIKGLAAYLARAGHARGISGCTILGDGEVSLILDVRGLAGEERAAG